MRFAKPLDAQMLHEVFGKYDKVITVEDGTITGGFGTAVAEFMIEHQYTARLKMLGIPDHYIEHGSLKELHRECGFDANGIADAVREMMNEIDNGALSAKREKELLIYCIPARKCRYFFARSYTAEIQFYTTIVFKGYCSVRSAGLLNFL